jgi:ASC-1-like (ASCH) protein
MEVETGLKRPLWPMIKSGAKSLEVRLAEGVWRKVVATDTILFRCGGEFHRRRVVEVARYDSFDAMLKVEDHTKILPGYTEAELRRLLGEIYPPEREREGVLVFELEVIT